MRKITLATAALAFALTGAASAAVSPSAPNAEQNASTVHLGDRPVRATTDAPRIDLSPSATTAERNATTVQDFGRRPGSVDAPRSGVSPSAPSYLQN